MKTYIAFLRGINVSGKKKVPMQSLRSLCTGLGFQKVQTYIQSGNIVFEYQETDAISLEIVLTDAINKEYGFEVPVLVKTVSQIKAIVAQNSFNDEEDIKLNKIYFVLLYQSATHELVIKFKSESFENEEFHLGENCIYLKCNLGYGKAKLNNNLIERKLKVAATTRNYRTLNKLIDLAI